MGIDSQPLKDFASTLNFELIGVCDAVPAPHLDFYEQWLSRGFHGSMDYLQRHVSLKKSPSELLPEVQSIIAVGLNYNQQVEWRAGQPRIARYALGRDYHKVLRGKLKRLAAWIEADQPGAKCRSCVDSAPIFERDFAHLAGLGWFGKNTCLINSKRGSWFFIGLLLTSVSFQPDVPAVGGCGSCRKCIDACPTGALVFDDDRWQVDSRKCISYLTIEHHGPIEGSLAGKVGDWTFGCDVCQEVCPFNQPRESQPMRATQTTERDFLNRKTWPGLVELTQLDQAQWDSLTEGSAVRRTGREGFARNAEVNLNNRPSSGLDAGQ